MYSYSETRFNNQGSKQLERYQTTSSLLMFEIYSAELPLHLLQASRLFQDGRLPITRDTRDMIFSDIPGLPPTGAMDLPAPLLEPSASLGEIQKSFAHISQADVILINTCYALEKPVLDARSRNERVGSPNLQVSLLTNCSKLILCCCFPTFQIMRCGLPVRSRVFHLFECPARDSSP